MDNLPIEKSDIEYLLSKFELEPKELNGFNDSSHGEEDVRWNFIFAEAYVLKVNSAEVMWEERLQEISRLTARYRSVGVYCPAYIPAKDGTLSYLWEHKGKSYICYVEEYAKYPIYGWDYDHDRKESVEHLGVLAAKYTNVDLSKTRSMWSIIDLAPLDVDVDEKQENTDMLADALRENGYPELADRVATFNSELREAIMPHFRQLPRCVFQGDLNSTNELHDNGKFIGLIDFNCSGTDVNINVFINETNWFPEEKDFDEMTISEIIEKSDREHADLSSVIYKHYTMNELEKQMYPYFKRITDMFQYPNVCEMVKWLKDENRREKCVDLIEAMVEQPLQKYNTQEGTSK